MDDGCNTISLWECLVFSFLFFEESGVRITLIIYFGKHNRSYLSTPSLLQFKRWEFKAAKTLGLPERLTYLLSQKLLWVIVHFIRYTENCLKKSVSFSAQYSMHLMKCLWATKKVSSVIFFWSLRCSQNTCGAASNSHD